jgi:two-component system chemotaxis response regulator CheB
MNATIAKKIRVLVVDDSLVIREVICDNIKQSPDLEVAGTAADGEEALRVFESAQPDVVTLDIHMPNMDGLATLDALLTNNSVPVIMVSALTQLGAEITFEALDRGAMDYVAKPDKGIDTKTALGEELLRKIRNVAGMDVQRILRIRRERKQRFIEFKQQRQVTAVQAKGTAHLSGTCIAIGISTGGPPALASLFAELRPPMPPIVVVQHMPPQFTKPLAWRLNSLSELSIKEASSGDVLCPNQVLIAPGGNHLVIHRIAGVPKAMVRDGATVSGHKPSVDVMMKSVAEVFKAKTLGIIMTGMGRDGVDGCRAIKQAGGYVLGQDEDTSDVYGMNKVAFVENCVDRQFSLDDAAAVITKQARCMHRLKIDAFEKTMA